MRGGIFLIAAIWNLVLSIDVHGAPGAMDPSFAGSGAKRLRFGFGDDFAAAVTVQPDGKVLVAGSTSVEYSPFGRTSIAIVRYNTNDFLDASFGDGGKVITTASLLTNAAASAAAIQVQSDGKIVVAGSLWENGGDFALLVRYHPDGSVDSTFGDGGIVRNHFNEGAQANAVVIQPNGKIVVGGFTHNGGGANFALARYETNGAIDRSFGNDGIATDDVGIAVNGLALQSDGKIIAVGWGGNYDFAVFRYTAGGSLDPGFGPDHTGRVITHLGGFSDFNQAQAVAIEPGDNLQNLDRIVVGGYTEAFNPPRFEVVRYKIDGSLDSTFGGSGVITVPVGAGFFNVANSIVVQGTGFEPRKIILAGYSSDNFVNQFCILRFNDNGTLDNSFDGDGKQSTSFGSDNDLAYGAALVAGEKLLVVGSTQINQNNHDFAMARYGLSDGAPDHSFGPGGRKTQDVGERPAQAKAMALQTDGRIVIVGAAENGISYGGIHSLALTRLLADGSVDPAFGQFGKTTATLGEVDSQLNAVAIQRDGRIVAAGSTGTNLLVVRYTTNGVFDPSFNGTGVVMTPIAASGNVASAIAFQADGKIVIAGSTGFGVEFAILRYNTNGTLDPSFDGDGKLTINFGSGINAASALEIQSDGKIIVGGYAVVGGTTLDFAAVRLKTNGVTDSTFGTFGAVLTELGAGRAQANAMALQPDGKLLLAGAVVIGATIQFAVVRYDTNGLRDPSFDGDGIVITPVALVDDEATGISVQADGKIVVTGSARLVGHQQFAAVRYLINGALDTTFGIGGKAFVDFGNDGNNLAAASVLDATGRILLAGDADRSFGMARMQASDVLLQVRSITRLTNGRALLTGLGEPNQTYSIQASTTLLPGSYQTLGQAVTDANGAWEFNDASATNFSKRFYRLAGP